MNFFSSDLGLRAQITAGWEPDAGQPQRWVPELFVPAEPDPRPGPRSQVPMGVIVGACGWSPGTVRVGRASGVKMTSTPSANRTSAVP